MYKSLPRPFFYSLHVVIRMITFGINPLGGSSVRSKFSPDDDGYISTDKNSQMLMRAGIHGTILLS